MSEGDEMSAPSGASAGCHGPAIMSWEQADQIMQDQRAEIERLRASLPLADAGFAVGGPKLTDEERELIRFAAVLYEGGGRPADAATLRGLLERHPAQKHDA